MEGMTMEELLICVLLLLLVLLIGVLHGIHLDKLRSSIDALETRIKALESGIPPRDTATSEDGRPSFETGR